MASSAERNEVLLGIIPGLAAQFPMVNLEIRKRAATLTPQPSRRNTWCRNCSYSLGARRRRELFDRNPVHDAFSVICSTNARRCSPGRNWKNRAIENKSTFGWPLSRLAPARKSAQIISRQ